MITLKKFSETFLLVMALMVSEEVQSVISTLQDVPAPPTVAVTMMTTIPVGIDVGVAKTDTTTRKTEAPGKVSFEILVEPVFIGLTLCKGGRRGYDDYSDSESSVSPRRRDKRRKSLGEQALAAVGLGGLAGAASGGGRSQSRSGRRRRYSSSPRSRSRTPERSAKIQQAVQAALTAGAVEAFRARKEPGGWGGEKGKRVLTAAIGAGGIDGLVDRDPNKKSTLHTVEAVIGGLAGNRLVNGPRDRSQSRGRGGGGGGGGGLKDLAAGGLAAAAGKALLDHRNRSKSRNRRRSYSSSSEDSRSPPRNRTRNRNQRSKSVSGFIDKGIDKGLAALGLRESENHREEYRDQQGSRRSDGYDDGYSQPRSMPREEVARMRGGGGEVKRGSSGSSSSDDMSSAEEDRTRKKMRGKEFLTAGLAAVATIHAGHEVYESYEAAQKRHKEVKEGTMSPQEARKMKSKAAFQDVAAVGIAALGIKSAVGEWKEMKEKRDECHEFEHKRDEKKKKRGQNGSQNGSQNSRPSYNGSNASYRSSAPNLYSSYQNGNMNGYGGRGPMYQDGNPYATGGLPPPPMGAPPARY